MGIKIRGGSYMSNLNPFELEESMELVKHEEWCEWDEEYRIDTYEYSYETLINSITDKVDWKVVSGFTDYQGDFFFFGEDKLGKVYFVNSGYGSCSGCDALKACDTYEELLSLRERLKTKIRQFDSLDEFVEWFNDIGQTEYYNDADVKRFVESMKDIYDVELIWRPDWYDED